MKMTKTETARETARQMVIDSVTEAATKDHERNYEKLHVMRDGTVSWFESINKSDDIIDRHASGFQAIPSVITVGTGSYACNCDHCAMVGEKDGYATQADAIYDNLVDNGTGDLEERMLAALEAIPAGYFEDESEA